MPTLVGPTYEENLWTNDALFARYKKTSGIALLVQGTTVTEAIYPYLGDLLNGGYDYIYFGGHEYELTPTEVTILTNAGYGSFIHP